MSKTHLDAWMSSRTVYEGAEAQAIGAFLTVLKHKSILEGADLDRLAQIAETGESERHRLRAAQLLGGWRQRAADALAGAMAVKEQVMDAKGLTKAGTQVAVLNFGGMSMERLKALAEGKPAPSEEDTTGLQIHLDPS
jgi:hypothetical protein